MTVRAVLNNKGHSVIAVPPTATVAEIAGLIAAQRIGAVLVLTEYGVVAGIVSERDVVKALARHGAGVVDLRASDLMTRNLTTATPETSVDEAMEIMDAGYFRHLPVLDDGRLVGVISVRDLVKYRLMQHQHDVESLKAYIAQQA